MYRRRTKRNPVAVVSPVTRTQKEVSPEVASPAVSQNKVLVSSPMKIKRKDTVLNTSKVEKYPRLTLTQSSKKRTYFEDVITSCGFILLTGDNPNLLSKDQVLFIRDVQNKFQEHRSYPRNVEEFMESLQDFCNDNNNFKKALSTTHTANECDVPRGPHQESLIRLLLSISCIQTKLIEFLFEKLTEFSFTEERNTDTADFPWIRTLLRQIRFLDHIDNPTILHDLIFAVLDAAPVSVQMEVIFCLPDIIGDQQHEEAARRLSELLLQNFELTPVILDTLSNLTLEAALRTKVTENVLKALRAVPVEFLPSIVCFLVTGTNSDDMNLVVSGLRKHLDFTPLSQPSSNGNTGSDASVKNSEVLTVANLCTSVNASRAMAEAWLNAIKAVRMPSDHRPLDLVMLLVLHSAVPGCKKVVQAIFRSKAKSGHFRETLLEKTFSTYLTVLKEYRTTLLEVASVLLRSPEPSVVHHASCWFKLALLHFEDHLGQGVVMQLLLYARTGDASHVRAALHVLADLADNHLECLAPHQLLLLNLLEKLEDLALPEVEQVLDVLCRIAYGPSQQHQTAIRNDVHMLIRKQLASSSPLVKKKGVLGAVMASKHIATKQEAAADNSSDMPDMDDKMKQAIQLMELVTTSTEAYPEVIGLFLDKLSAIICKADDLEGTLIEWISNHVGTDFEENYICYKKGLQLTDNMQLQYEISDADEGPPDDDDDEVCIMLAQLVEKESGQQRSCGKVLTMNSSVRLVRCIKHLSEGDLSDVAALLTCGVVMPIISEEEFDLKDPEEQQFILDCMFHCANWFRELLSAFSYQNDLELRKRMRPVVLQRLSDLVSLQQRILKSVPHAVDYVPPPCQFYATAKPPQPPKLKKVAAKKKRKSKGKKGGKKKRKKGADDTAAEEEGVEEEEVEEEEEEPESAPSIVSDISSLKSLQASLPEYRGFLRELDVDVLILLHEKLVLNPTEDKTCLTPSLLLFLLEDFAAKLEHLLTASVKCTSHLKAAAVAPIGFANLETFSAVNFASNTVKMLPQLCAKLEAIAEYCQNLLDESDGVRDAPSMFPEGSAIIKLCYSQLMRTIADLFAWNGFQSSANASLVKDGLRVLASRLDAEGAKLGSVRELVREAARYLQSYVERTVHLLAAGSLVKLMEALGRINDTDTALKKQIAEMCGNFLSQRWSTLSGASERGSIYNQQVDMLLKSHASCVEDKLQSTSDMVAVVHTELEHRSENKDWSLDVYPTITKANFPLLFRCLCATLVTGTQEQLDTTSSESARFEIWEMAVNTLKMLMQIVKLQSGRNNLVAFFKNALRFMKLFLVRGLPVLGVLIRTKTANVTALLQTLQKSTRFLNTLCYHSKVTKDGTLTQQVPAMRLVLEQMPMAVRALLTQNGCGDAFWLGVLRNRNLQGEEVLTQQEEAVPEEQDDLPPDESSGDDLDMDEQEQNGSEQEDEDASDII